MAEDERQDALVSQSELFVGPLPQPEHISEYEWIAPLRLSPALFVWSKRQKRKALKEKPIPQRLTLARRRLQCRPGLRAGTERT